MHLLIVDDEAHWVDNLSQTKPWHTLGIQSVHKAYSSYEALDIIRTYPIDIVISDIRMPEMTGLELFEHIVKRIERSGSSYCRAIRTSTLPSKRCGTKRSIIFLSRQRTRNCSVRYKTPLRN